LTLASGATEMVASDVILSGASAGVPGGVTLIALAGGTISANEVSSGGTEIVLSDGVASETVLGGTEIISAGGTGWGSTVLGGGLVIDAGTVLEDMVQSGGTEIVSSGAVLSDVALESGAELVIHSGAIISDLTPDRDSILDFRDVASGPNVRVVLS